MSAIWVFILVVLFIVGGLLVLRDTAKHSGPPRPPSDPRAAAANRRADSANHQHDAASTDADTETDTDTEIEAEIETETESETETPARDRKFVKKADNDSRY